MLRATAESGHLRPAAFNAMPDQEQRLSDLRRLLRRGAGSYLVDLGRSMSRVLAQLLVFSSIKKKEHGLVARLEFFAQGREIAKQNKIHLKAQNERRLLTHHRKQKSHLLHLCQPAGDRQTADCFIVLQRHARMSAKT